jgi:hypothetical protein
MSPLRIAEPTRARCGPFISYQRPLERAQHCSSTPRLVSTIMTLGRNGPSESRYRHPQSLHLLLSNSCHTSLDNAIAISYLCPPRTPKTPATALFLPVELSTRCREIPILQPIQQIFTMPAFLHRSGYLTTSIHVRSQASVGRIYLYFCLYIRGCIDFDFENQPRMLHKIISLEAL